MPLTIQSNQRLAFFQFRTATCTVIRIEILRTRRLLQDFVLLLLGSGFRWTCVLLRHSFLLDGLTSADTLLAENFLSGVGYLRINRFC